MNFEQLIILGLQASIFLTVFGYGLQATVDDLLYLVRGPAVLVRSFVAMFVTMPIVAVIITETFELHAAVEIALVALAISPIPPLLPQRVVKAGGGASYGLGLMATAALVSIVFIPLAVRVIGWFFGQSLAISPGVVARLALLTVLVPLAAGMVFRATVSTIADRIQKPVALIAIVLLGLGILAILIAALPAVFALVGNGTIVVIVAFVVVGLAVGHLLAGKDRNDQIVLAISTACRHPAIALAIAHATDPQERLVGGAILLYLLLNILVSIPYVRWQRLKSGAK